MPPGSSRWGSACGAPTSVRASSSCSGPSGAAADVIDPLTDDLADPLAPDSPYDGVWASACLLHVARADVPTVLRRLAAATRVGGTLHVSLKEGEGEVWSSHGHVAQPRHFTLWQEDPLREVLTSAGWVVDEITRKPGLREDRWLDVLATRGEP